VTTTYTALCEREGRWWVVTVPELKEGGVTQSRTLDQVPATVADLVALMTDTDPATVEVDMKVRRKAAGHGLSAGRVASIAGAGSAAAAIARRLIRTMIPR
jgi:hypothetical protein